MTNVEARLRIMSATFAVSATKVYLRLRNGTIAAPLPNDVEGQLRNSRASSTLIPLPYQFRTDRWPTHHE
jgi:hypothetical protein